MTSKRYYAGVGSRETPPAMLEKLKQLAIALAKRGYVLRSGAADGADAAFEAGAVQSGVLNATEIWLPWPGFNKHADTEFLPTPAHYEKAATVHPAWERLKQGAKSLHARNTGQVSGRDLETHVDFVLCWTRDGCESEAERTAGTGGTATAICLADRLGIPVFNLAKEGSYWRFVEFVLAVDRPFHEDGTLPPADANMVWVFGSNLAGRHGKGAAEVARLKFGAQPGIGRGRMGQSYGIPTKQVDPAFPLVQGKPAKLLPRSLEDIRKEIEVFIEYAKHNQNESFFVTRTGCDLAGYADKDIAPMYARAPSNCSFPEPWKPWLGPQALKRSREAHQASLDI